MDTLVDSNVLIDVFERDPTWHDWSVRQLEERSRAGRLLINPLIYAEISLTFSDSRKLDALLGEHFGREDLPWDAAFLAGRAYEQYRRSGGVKTSPLPDFYIGAHALTRHYPLLTRDTRRYKAYFPKLKLIAP